MKYGLLLGVLLGGCIGNGEYKYTPARTAQVVKEAPAIERGYKRQGKILPAETYQNLDKIIMWNHYMGMKDSIYRFSAGQEVIVYGKVSEYYYLSPASDTTIAGFLLAGWVEFDHSSPRQNIAAHNDVPTYVPVTPATTGTMAAPNLGKLALRYEKRLRKDSVIYDEKHIMQDELEMSKRADSIPLFFEKDGQ